MVGNDSKVVAGGKNDGRAPVEKKVASTYKLPELGSMGPLFDFENDRKCFSQISCETINNLGLNFWSVACTWLFNEFKLCQSNNFWANGRLLLH